VNATADETKLAREETEMTALTTRRYYQAPTGHLFVAADYNLDEDGVVETGYWSPEAWDQDANPTFFAGPGGEIDRRSWTQWQPVGPAPFRLADLTPISGIVRIEVEPECSAEEWWDLADRAADGLPVAGYPVQLPPELRPFFGPGGYSAQVYVSAERAEAIEAWCARLRGWEDGPAYAPHPLRFVPVG